MAQKVYAIVNPDLLIWARKSARLTQEQVAAKLDRSLELIQSRETNQSKPTIPQARKLASIYKRPLASFYLASPPEDFQVLTDFRRLPANEFNIISPKLEEIIRTITSNQQWLNEYLISEGKPALSFVGKFTMKSSSEEVASFINDYFGVFDIQQKEAGDPSSMLSDCIKRLESLGVFIVKESLPVEECRGCAFSDDIAPFILINSNDSPRAQIFSLIHELCHILLAQKAISNMNPRGHYASPHFQAVEVFCNQVASLVLVDRRTLMDAVKKNTSMPLEEFVKFLSLRFKVSNICIARSLLDISAITQEEYDNLDDAYYRQWLEYDAKKKAIQARSEGGPSYYKVKISHNGVSFTATVLDAYYNGKLLAYDASSLLNVKINNMSTLSKELHSYLM